jgi:hypothetical protein
MRRAAKGSRVLWELLHDFERNVAKFPFRGRVQGRAWRSTDLHARDQHVQAAVFAIAATLQPFRSSYMVLQA